MKSILHNFLNPAHSIYFTKSALYFGPTIWVKIPSEIRNLGFKQEIKKWKPTDCPIISLIIHISWLVILHIHLLKKILPVSTILCQVTFIYHHPPPFPPDTHTIQPCEKPLHPWNNHEKKFRPKKFPGIKSLDQPNTKARWNRPTRPTKFSTLCKKWLAKEISIWKPWNWKTYIKKVLLFSFSSC